MVKSKICLDIILTKNYTIQADRSNFLSEEKVIIKPVKQNKITRQCKVNYTMQFNCFNFIKFNLIMGFWGFGVLGFWGDFLNMLGVFLRGF